MSKHPARAVSPAALAEAQDLVPYLAAAIEAQDPCVAGLNMNDIEQRAASVGDLVSRLLFHRALERQKPVSRAEEAAVRQAALAKASPERARGQDPAQLKVVVQRDKLRTLKTIRGPVPLQREYWYFPGLRTGVFPPRPETAIAHRESDASGGAGVIGVSG